MKRSFPIEFSVSKITDKKAIAGIVLALVSFFVCSIWFYWKAGLAFCVVFLAIGFLKIDTQNKFIAAALNLFWGIVCIAVISLFSPVTGFPVTTLTVSVLNFLCAFLVVSVVYMISVNWRLSITISSCILGLLSTANAIIYQFRGKELGIMDFLSIGTALSVADQYKLEVRVFYIYFWAFGMICLLAQCAIPSLPKEKTHNLQKRGIALLAAIVSFAAIHFGSSDIPIKTWDYEGSLFNGYYLNFYLGIRDAFVEKPANYSPETVEKYGSNYTEGSAPEDMPNIIVIMDEAFSDLSIFENELSTNQPVTPFIDALSENTVRGYALSSVYGGNTANSEFEFLTSHTMAFLPTGSVPYQQYLSGDLYSLAHLMNSYGYTSMATHPYYSSGWSRTTAYPWLGLDSYTFVEDYPAQNIIRKYVSDQEMFEYVLDRMYTKDPEEDLFLFGITMQNHSAYDYEGENYTQSIELEGYAQQYPQAEQYLSLIHETDQAVEYLLTALADYPEDTVVLFFGDHLPKLETEFYEELNGGPFDTLDEQMLQYSVPFFIWANYDIEEKYVECTGINYLAGYLLEAAGLELPAYYQALADIEAVIPAINANGYYSVEQGKFIPLDEAAGKEAEMLEMYANIQYNNLFDEENRSKKFFGQYMD